MSHDHRPLALVSQFLDRQFLWLVLAGYALATVFPEPGLWLRDLSLIDLRLAGESSGACLPMLLLAALLWNAGMGMPADQLRHLLHRPGILFGGLIANLVVPVAYIAAVA